MDTVLRRGRLIDGTRTVPYPSPRHEDKNDGEGRGQVYSDRRPHTPLVTEEQIRTTYRDLDPGSALEIGTTVRPKRRVTSTQCTVTSMVMKRDTGIRGPTDSHPRDRNRQRRDRGLGRVERNEGKKISLVTRTVKVPHLIGGPLSL